MEKSLTELKEEYYLNLDKKAEYTALEITKGKPVGKLLLNYIEELYLSAKTGTDGYKDKYFEVAYHPPITSDLEFLIAKIVGHFSEFKNLGWKVCLRRQQKDKTSPDKKGKAVCPDVRIEIESTRTTLAIIEIKASAGWIKALFSREREKKDRLKEGKSNVNLSDKIMKIRAQIEKYCKTFDISRDKFYVLLPSLILMHKKRSTKKLEDYENDFAEHSGLPKRNLILLSNNPSLNLSKVGSNKEYNPTENFEKLVMSLAS